MRGQERELILLRSENGETWKEHVYDCRTADLNKLLNGMDEGEARVIYIVIVPGITLQSVHSQTDFMNE